MGRILDLVEFAVIAINSTFSNWIQNTLNCFSLKIAFIAKLNFDVMAWFIRVHGILSNENSVKVKKAQVIIWSFVPMLSLLIQSFLK